MTKRILWTVLAVTLPLLTAIAPARAEMLAMVVYETKAEESIRKLRLEEAQRPREDGLAIIDIDMNSENYGKILMTFPLPKGAAPHHQYYNKDATKIYVTATLLPMLHVVDLTRNPYRVKRIDTPGCQRLDTVAFSDDNKTWWLTCIGSQKLVVGDAVTDTVTGEIALPEPGPHGLDLHQGLDRLIVTDIGESFQEFGETVTIIEASTGTVLSSHKVSHEPSPSHVGPSEVRFLRRTDPPMAYITINLGGAERMGALWAATWNPDKRDFEVQEVFDFAPTGGSLPVAMGTNSDESLLFVSTIRPGQFHIFDISGDPLKPKLLKTLPAGQGAHHAALTPDERTAFVQNGVLNLPGLSDGAITVVDLEKLEVIDSIDTFKDAGYAINHILMLPQ